MLGGWVVEVSFCVYWVMCGEGKGRGEGGGRERKVPTASPLPRPILEDLQHGGPDIMFGIEPRQRDVRMEGGPPLEAAVGLKVHAEERIRQAGEVVVVDTRIDEGGGEADLADIVLDGKLGAPEREGGPLLVGEDAVVRHGAVDVVLDGGLLGGVGEGAACGDLVAVEGRVDEG